MMPTPCYDDGIEVGSRVEATMARSESLVEVEVRALSWRPNDRSATLVAAPAPLVAHIAAFSAQHLPSI